MPVTDPALKLHSAQDVHTAGNGTATFTLPRNSAGAVCVQVDLLTLTGGTNPTVQFRLQWSMDGTTWVEGDPAEPFTALSAVGGAAKVFQAKAALCRLAWTVTGVPATATADVFVWAP